MLQTLQHTSFSHKVGAVPTTTLLRIFYDKQTQIQVIEDLQPARDLAHIITCQDSIELLQSDHATLGFSLGSWLRDFHSWTEEPTQLELRRFIAYGTSSQDLKWRTTYDAICAIVEPFSDISKDDKRVLEQVRVRAFQEYQQKTNASLVHGDFWTGK
jgi:fructosamine-3-kinase